MLTLHYKFVIRGGNLVTCFTGCECAKFHNIYPWLHFDFVKIIWKTSCNIKYKSNESLIKCH